MLLATEVSHLQALVAKSDPLEVFPSRKDKLYITMHSFLYDTGFTKDLKGGAHLEQRVKWLRRALSPLPHSWCSCRRGFCAQTCKPERSHRWFLACVQQSTSRCDAAGATLQLVDLFARKWTLSMALSIFSC